jgi:hypothetical protein
MLIRCLGCDKERVEARLTNGAEIYPHRKDLNDLPFWKCDDCGNFVGCHHKTSDRTKPLGCIATPEIKNARKHIHALLDPLWSGSKTSRTKIYQMITDKIGWKYHTANIRTIEEARNVYRIILDIKDNADI